MSLPVGVLRALVIGGAVAIGVPLLRAVSKRLKKTRGAVWRKYKKAYSDATVSQTAHSSGVARAAAVTHQIGNVIYVSGVAGIDAEVLLGR